MFGAVFRVQGARCRVWGAGFACKAALGSSLRAVAMIRVAGVGCSVWGAGCRVQGAGFACRAALGSSLRAVEIRCWVWCLRCRVHGVGERDCLKSRAWLIPESRCDNQLQKKVVHLSSFGFWVLGLGFNV